MATYDYEQEVPLGSTFRDKPPRLSGYRTYVKGSVDTYSAGDYILEYTLIREDPFDSISQTKKVTVVDSTGAFDTREPVIQLNGSHVVTIPQGTAWIDPGAEAYTKETFESLEVKTALPVDAGSWAYQPAGNYSVAYYAETSGGKVALAVRTVSIIAVSATASLNGCSKIYIEYPSSGGALSYVGQNFTGSGNIVVDAGYSVSGSNYSVEIGVEPEDGEIYIVTEDKVFFTADPAQTKTYKIFYKVTSQEGYERTSTREVVMMKQNETDTTVLSGLEFQKNSPDGCADREPIISEEDLLYEDLEEHGNSVFDDPVLSPTPTDVPDPVTYDSLYLFCAGHTAFSGGLAPSTWGSNPGKIPNQIVENWYAPASTRTAWDSFFTVVNGAYMPGENEKTEWTGKGSPIIWKLHKIHSETKVTYSYSYGLGAAPILYSTWEPYYVNGARVGDIFYGFYGAHVFLESEGWSANLSKESISFKEFLGERTYRGLHPYSFTRVTAALKAMHVAKISASNIPEVSVFQDSNKRTLNNGAVLHSVPLFRGIDEKIARGGTGVAGEDMISLRWRSLGGVTDASKYCNYTLPPPPPEPQVQLPLYCNTTFDKYVGFDGVANPYNYDYEANRAGPVPGVIVELTWTDNPHYGLSWPSLNSRHSLVNLTEFSVRHTWWLVQISYNSCTYILSSGGETRTMTIDPSDPTKTVFNGFVGTYSFNHAHAAAYWGSSNVGAQGMKYITNYNSGHRIPENNPPSGLSSNFTYYNSLAFGGAARDSALNSWVDPTGSKRTYTRWHPLGTTSDSGSWELIGDPVDPC